MIKVGIIIPDRGDRPEFTANCLRMIRAQTRTPYAISHINHPPTSNDIDLVQRYREGYDKLSPVVDVIACIENDDWYDPSYLGTMIDAWIISGEPEIFGIPHTVQYHLGLKKFNVVEHPGRSSMNSTFIKSKLNFNWGDEKTAYLDMWIWKVLQGETYKPQRTITISMKHGQGKCGGQAHHYHKQYRLRDYHLQFLDYHLDPESFKFYSTLQL